MSRCVYNSKKCVFCGRPIPPEGRSAARECAPRGLGDLVADGLSAVGITKERVQAVASAVGVKDCGCGRRAAALNRLGEKLGLPAGSTAENRQPDTETPLTP